MIKSTIFNVWLSDNSRVNISSKYDFDEEFDIIFKETTTGLSSMECIYICFQVLIN